MFLALLYHDSPSPHRAKGYCRIIRDEKTSAADVGPLPVACRDVHSAGH